MLSVTTKTSMKIILMIGGIASALLLLQNCIVAIQGTGMSELPLNIDTVVVKGNGGSCPAEHLRHNAIAGAIANVESKANNQQLREALLLIESRERVCECGYAGAGWRRVAFFNMTDTDQSCPGEWQLHSSPRRTCQRSVDNGCSLVAFTAGGVSYSEVCGRIVGYQFGSTDAFFGPIHGRLPDQASFDLSLYDGGVFISHGTVPRQHIWSLAIYSQWKFTKIKGQPGMSM